MTRRDTPDGNRGLCLGSGTMTSNAVHTVAGMRSAQGPAPARSASPPGMTDASWDHCRSGDVRATMCRFPPDRTSSHQHSEVTATELADHMGNRPHRGSARHSGSMEAAVGHQSFVIRQPSHGPPGHGHRQPIPRLATDIGSTSNGGRALRHLARRQRPTRRSAGESLHAAAPDQRPARLPPDRLVPRLRGGHRSPPIHLLHPVHTTANA